MPDFSHTETRRCHDQAAFTAENTEGTEEARRTEPQGRIWTRATG